MEVGKREIIYLSLHCHHQNDSCIKMGSDESHFNVSVGSDGQSHKTVSSNHNLCEEKGEPKRYRTEVLPPTSLTPYRWAKPGHIRQKGTEPLVDFIGANGSLSVNQLAYNFHSGHTENFVFLFTAVPAVFQW